MRSFRLFLTFKTKGFPSSLVFSFFFFLTTTSGFPGCSRGAVLQLLSCVRTANLVSKIICLQLSTKACFTRNNDYAGLYRVLCAKALISKQLELYSKIFFTQVILLLRGVCCLCQLALSEKEVHQYAGMLSAEKA